MLAVSQVSIPEKHLGDQDHAVFRYQNSSSSLIIVIDFRALEAFVG